MSVSCSNFESPEARWKTLAPRYCRLLKEKRDKFSSRSVFLFNSMLGLFFSGAGMMYTGALLSDYKITLMGVSLFFVSFYGFHITVMRFKEFNSKIHPKIEEAKNLMTVEGLKQLIPAIIDTEKPRYNYPIILVKTGILSQAVFDQLNRFKEDYLHIDSSERVEWKARWITFQKILADDIPTDT